MASSSLPLGRSRQMKGVKWGTAGGAQPPLTPTAATAARCWKACSGKHQPRLPPWLLLYCLETRLGIEQRGHVQDRPSPEMARTPWSARMGTAARVSPGTSRWLAVILGGRWKARSRSCVRLTANCAGGWGAQPQHGQHQTPSAWGSASATIQAGSL